MQNCRKHTGGLQDPRKKTMKNEAARAKSEGQHIHGAFHTRQVHTSCKWGHTKMAHPSPDHSIGEDYAKMKAEPCKIVENTREDSRTHEKKPWKMKQREPKVKVNIYMELSTQDRCIHRANGGTLRWHTPLSRPFNRGRLCKNEARTMQNCRKHTGRLQDPRKKHEKWTSASQKWRSTYTWSFPHKTGAYILQKGGH